jgi:hypothetical protein
MAQPRDVLMIDIPGLTVADVQALGARTPNLRALARDGWAKLVPIAAGFEHARQATIATGLLPMHHGVVHSGQYQLRAKTFWQRAGLEAAYFGPSRMLQELADAALYVEGENMVFKPAAKKAAFNEGAPRVGNSGDFDPVFVHFARRAASLDYRVVWLELVHLAVHQIIGIVANRQIGPEPLRRVDSLLGDVLRSAGDRVVVVFSSTTLRAATHALSIAEAGTKMPGDWRLLHARCDESRIPALADALQATGAYARVVHGRARGELGVDCAEAGTVVAELKPGWGFAPSAKPAACASGADSEPRHLPVLLARGLKLEKEVLGMCEVAWLIEHALTGREYRDDSR